MFFLLSHFDLKSQYESQRLTNVEISTLMLTFLWLGLNVVKVFQQISQDDLYYDIHDYNDSES